VRQPGIVAANHFNSSVLTDLIATLPVGQRYT
jgi:hypothetical protein